MRNIPLLGGWNSNHTGCSFAVMEFAYCKYLPQASDVACWNSSERSDAQILVGSTTNYFQYKPESEQVLAIARVGPKC